MVSTPIREAGQGPESFRSLLEVSYQRRNLIQIAAGSQIPLLRGNIWLVVRGMVKLAAITIHGDDQLLGLAGPNEPFGEPLCGVEAFEARTLCDTDLLCLSMAEIQADPGLAAAMLQAIAQRCRQNQALLGLLALRRVEERVRGFLELLAIDYGQACDQGLRLNLRLTHQDLASALATTRVTVTRTISALREQGWLRIDGQRHLVIAHLPRP